MTQKQLIEQIKQLPISDRISLIEAISRSLREELESGNGVAQEAKVSEADLKRQREAKTSSVSRLRGILKFDGPSPSDEEVKEIITDYLTEKYS